MLYDGKNINLYRGKCRLPLLIVIKSILILNRMLFIINLFLKIIFAVLFYMDSDHA